MSAQDRANAAKGMAEWTEEEKIDAAGKVYEAVTSRAEMWARKDAIIAAHNENAIRLQCEVTALRGALEQLQAAVLTEGLERTSDEEDKRGAINFLGLMDAMKQSREILTHAAKKTEIMMMSDKTADPNIEATLRALSPDIYAARDGIWWASLYLGTTWKDAIRHTYVRNYMKLNPEAKLPAVEEPPKLSMIRIVHSTTRELYDELRSYMFDPVLDTINSATRYNDMPPLNVTICRHPLQRYAAT